MHHTEEQLRLALELVPMSLQAHHSPNADKRYNLDDAAEPPALDDRSGSIGAFTGNDEKVGAHAEGSFIPLYSCSPGCRYCYDFVVAIIMYVFRDGPHQSSSL